MSWLFVDPSFDDATIDSLAVKYTKGFLTGEIAWLTEVEWRTSNSVWPEEAKKRCWSTVRSELLKAGMPPGAPIPDFSDVTIQMMDMRLIGGHG